MIETVLSLVAAFTQYSKENPVLAGALSLWGLGTFSYLARNVPSALLRIIKKQFTTTLTLVSTSEAFHKFLDWYNRNGYGKRLRSFKISCGKYGDEESKKSIGYGSHFFLYKYRPGLIHLIQKETHTSMERDQIDIVLLGRSREVYDRIFREIREMEAPENTLVVNRYNGDYWEKIETQRKRDITTVFLNMGAKEKILSSINNFKLRENWYVKNGLQYQFGILLYGPPGCGKTSMVKALASHFNYELYTLPSSKMATIDVAMSKLPEYSLLLIEDIDTDSIVNSRVKTPPGETGVEVDSSGFLSGLSMSNLSDVLNAIDGVVSSHGRVLVSTTNHIEKLDGALIRDGRFDLRMELGYADDFVVRQFMSNYYPDYEVPSGFTPRKELAAASIQAMILRNLNDPENVIKELEGDG